jgi:hypothetical protein
VITDSPDCDGELVVCHDEPELPEIPSAPTPAPTPTP